jgi:hypothetical protein
VRLRLIGFVIDVTVILIFVAIGRNTHDAADPVLGLLSTAWPFLVGLLIGWLIALAPVQRVRALAPLQFWGGVLIWGTTIVMGMLLRALSSDGTALAFMIVAIVTVGIGLLGWRTVGHQLRRRRLDDGRVVAE